MNTLIKYLILPFFLNILTLYDICIAKEEQSAIANSIINSEVTEKVRNSLFQSQLEEAGLCNTENMSHDILYLVACSRPNIRGIISAVSAAGNFIPNPKKITDIGFLFYVPHVSKLLTILEKLYLPKTNFMLQNIINSVDGNIDSSQTFILRGIVSCNDVKDIALGKRSLTTILPLKQAVSTGADIWCRELVKIDDSILKNTVNILNIPNNFGMVVNELQTKALPYIMTNKAPKLNSITKHVQDLSLPVKNLILKEHFAVNLLKDIGLISTTLPNEQPAEVFLSTAGANDIMQKIKNKEFLVYKGNKTCCFSTLLCCVSCAD